MSDREKIIKGLVSCNSASCQKCPYNEKKECNNKGFFYSQAIEDALVLLKERGWNVLTEDADGVIHGLPGDDGQYIMTDGKDIWIDDYVDGVADGIILDSGRDIRELTAWMYMPELPKKVRR